MTKIDIDTVTFLGEYYTLNNLIKKAIKETREQIKTLDRLGLYTDLAKNDLENLTSIRKKLNKIK